MIWRSVLAILFFSLFLPSLLIAGDNPDMELFIEWDTYDTNYVEPTIGGLVANVYAGNLGFGGGLSSIALRVSFGSNLIFTGFTPAAGGLVIGDIEGDGAAIGWAECLVPNESGKVFIGALSCFYAGSMVSDSVQILPHVVEGSDVADCDLDIDSWCVRLEPSGNAGVWAAPPPGNCDPPGEVWNVPVDAPTIQAGIDSAVAGDTVRIATGTYHEYSIAMKSGVVLLGATGDPDDVIIDADSLGRVILCNACDHSTQIRWITVTGGYAAGELLRPGNGGGICSYYGEGPVISNCVFTGNAADSTGRGHGGGLYAIQSDPAVYDCLFDGNYAYTGGGAYGYYSDVHFHNVVFENHHGSLFGGGMGDDNSATALDSCQFLNNSASHGGALFMGGYSGTLNVCTFSGNYGAIGEAIRFNDSSPTMTNCTLVDNTGDGFGTDSQIYLDNTVLLLTNSIVAFAGTGRSIYCDPSSSVEISCTDIYGNPDGDWVDDLAPFDSINGNFHTDPLFCTSTWNPDSAYTLQGASKCAGDTCGLIGSMPVGCGHRVTWIHADSTDWNDPANWNPVRVPGVNDEAYIPAGQYEVQYSGNSTIWKLTMETSVWEPSLYIESDTLSLVTGGRSEAWINVEENAAIEVQAGGVFTVGDSATFTLRGGHLLGDGSFVNGGWFRKASPVKTQTVSVVMLDFENRLDDPGDGAIIVWDSTLSFEGVFANECTVIVKGNSELQCVPDGGVRAESTITNSGTIIVEDGGVLTVDGEETEFLNLDGGKVLLKGTGSIVGSGLFVNGGEVNKNDPTKSRAISSIAIRFDNRHDDPGDGALTVVDGVLSIEDEFVNAGSTFVRSSAQALLDPGDGASPPDAMTNSGVLILESSADLIIQDSGTVCTNLLGGEVILEGGNIEGEGLLDNYGTLIKTDPAKTRALSSVACAINNRHDDPGDGAIVASDGTLSIEDVFVNSGSLFVSATAQVLLDPGDGALRSIDMTHNGIVVVEPDGHFGLNGIVSNSVGSDWVVGGTVLVDSFGEVTHYGAIEIEPGGTLENDGDFAHKENAVLSGAGTFDNTEGNYSCGGVIRPGGSIGTFSFLGDFYQTWSSEIHVEIGGTVPGTGHDLFAISGSATLDGAMHVDIVEPFEPIEGDSFAIVTIGGVKHASRGNIDCFSGLEIPGNLYLEPVEEPDVFAFRAVDSTSSNSEPVAVDDLDSTYHNETKTLSVVENDTDPDIDPVTIVSVSLGGVQGDATVDVGDTTLTYTPLAGWHGLDTLVYLITDCNGGVDSAYAVVFVPRAPRIWSVPGDAPTIQAGIDSSIVRDTVELTDGTYTGDGNRDLDFNGKAIVVRSENDDPAACVIDCEGTPLNPHRAFYFHNGEDSTSILRGVTITGGYQLLIGGGVFCTGASPEVINCVISENSVGPDAGATGGAVHCSNGASPSFNNCVIANNSAELGGGIRCYNSCAIRLNGCTFYGNSAAGTGGAASITVSSTAMITNTIIAFNVSGGAVRCNASSSVTLACCDVYGNTGGDYVDCISGMNGVDGNISADPWFCEPDSGNFALDINSPCLDAPGCSRMGAYGSACDIITLVPEMGEPDLPSRYGLSQNIPNPFNPVTKLRFSLPSSGHVRLIVYDVTGREVNVLVDRGLQAGEFEAVWNGRNRYGRSVGSGVYFARMTAGGFTAVRKMVLLK